MEDRIMKWCIMAILVILAISLVNPFLSYRNIINNQGQVMRQFEARIKANEDKAEKQKEDIEDIERAVLRLERITKVNE